MDARSNILGYTTQPPGFRLIFESQPDGVTFIDQPTHRLGREAGGVIAMAIALVLIAALSVGAVVNGQGAPWYVQFGLLVIVFPLVAILLVIRVRLGRAPITLGVERDTLFLITPTPFGESRRQWKREQIRSIAARKLGGCVLLQFHRTPGRRLLSKQVQVFAGHRHQDLNWVADQLNRALELQQQESPGA